MVFQIRKLDWATIAGVLSSLYIAFIVFL